MHLTRETEHEGTPRAHRRANHNLSRMSTVSLILFSATCVAAQYTFTFYGNDATCTNALVSESAPAPAGAASCAPISSALASATGRTASWGWLLDATPGSTLLRICTGTQAACGSLFGDSPDASQLSSSCFNNHLGECAFSTLLGGHVKITGPPPVLPAPVRPPIAGERPAVLPASIPTPLAYYKLDDGPANGFNLAESITGNSASGMHASARTHKEVLCTASPGGRVVLFVRRYRDI